jgi:hypothetical protein
MTFEEIQAMWEQDSKIDPVELDTAALNIPTLHSKYLNFFSDYKFKKKLAVLDLKQLNRRKYSSQIYQCILNQILKSKTYR